MFDTTYIRSVLERFEGKAIAKGYVPADKNGQPFGASGVTIATGLDLGQQSHSVLIGMGVPEVLAGRLSPYLGLKGREAQYVLAKFPLLLTEQEVELLDDAVHARYIAETSQLFGRAAFNSAPRQVQAVAVSLHYQFGTPARKASPALGEAWAAMQSGYYLVAAAVLREAMGWSVPHQQYLKRRRAEAALLEEVRI